MPTPRTIFSSASSLRPPEGTPHLFDVASELGRTAVAWRIRDLSTGEQEDHLCPRSRDGDVLPGLLQDVAQWATERAGDDQVSLRCFSIALRDAASENLPRDRFVPAELISLNSSAVWAQNARSELRESLQAHDRKRYYGRVLYGASDGSVHPKYGHGAYAWVCADGRWHVGRSHASILVSELMGILSFVDDFCRRGEHHSAVLFVDSLNAIEAITSRSFVSTRLDPARWALAQRLVRSGRVELVWVRSHQGHLLNGVADRLALQRHRAVRSKLTAEQLRALCQQIVDGAADELASTDWPRQARLARATYRDHLRKREQAA